MKLHCHRVIKPHLELKVSRDQNEGIRTNHETKIWQQTRRKAKKQDNTVDSDTELKEGRSYLSNSRKVKHKSSHEHRKENSRNCNKKKKKRLTKPKRKVSYMKSLVKDVTKLMWGETWRGVDVRLKEHKNYVKFHRVSNAIVLHIEKCDHLPDWDRTRLLEQNIK